MYHGRIQTCGLPLSWAFKHKFIGSRGNPMRVQECECGELFVNVLSWGIGTPFVGHVLPEINPQVCWLGSVLLGLLCSSSSQLVSSWLPSARLSQISGLQRRLPNCWSLTSPLFPIPVALNFYYTV